MTVTDMSSTTAHPRATLTQTSWRAVCPLDRLQPGRGAAALIGGRQVALFRIEEPAGTEELYALDNVDPVSGVGCLSRGIVGDLKGEPMVASPMYKQHYSLVTGRGLDDPATSVAVFPIRVVDGVVEVSLLEVSLP